VALQSNNVNSKDSSGQKSPRNFIQLLMSLDFASPIDAMNHSTHKSDFLLDYLYKCTPRKPCQSHIISQQYKLFEMSQSTDQLRTCNCGFDCPSCRADFERLRDVSLTSEERREAIQKWLEEVPFRAEPPGHQPWRSSLGVIVPREYDAGEEEEDDDHENVMQISVTSNTVWRGVGASTQIYPQYK
jgi:hypothetical protein